MAQIEFVEKLPSEIIKEAENLNEIPNKIRFLVEGAPNIESKIATLEKFYDKVEMHPTQKGNFIVTEVSILRGLISASANILVTSSP